MAQKLNKSISQNKLDADLPGMIKKSSELEKEYDINYVLDDAHELIGDCSDGAARIQSIVHELIFNPFFTTKEVGKGVGLGLTTALNIILMHNGSIICRSEPGIETVFTVRLPDSGGTV